MIKIHLIILVLVVRFICKIYKKINQTSSFSFLFFSDIILAFTSMSMHDFVYRHLQFQENSSNNHSTYSNSQFLTFERMNETTALLIVRLYKKSFTHLHHFFFRSLFKIIIIMQVWFPMFIGKSYDTSQYHSVINLKFQVPVNSENN